MVLAILLSIFTTLTLSSYSHASGSGVQERSFVVSIGLDLFDSVSKTESLNRVHSAVLTPSSAFNRHSIGFSIKPFLASHLRLSYKTNSLLNLPETYRSRGGALITTQAKSQSYIVSHPISTKWSPYLIMSDVVASTSVNGSKKAVANHLMYGVGVSYLLTPTNAVSLTYFLPSKGFNTSYSYGASYSYFI